jgi:hypothetical protein
MKSVNQLHWSLYRMSKVEQIKSSFPFINMFIIQRRSIFFTLGFKRELIDTDFFLFRTLEITPEPQESSSEMRNEIDLRTKTDSI